MNSSANPISAVPRVARLVWPVGTLLIFLLAWDAGVRLSGSDLFPKPGEVLRGIVELAQKGLLVKYIVASLFRVTWGFALAVSVPQVVAAQQSAVAFVAVIQQHHR